MNRLQVWLGCVVVLGVCTHPLAHAQKAEKPRGAEVASFFLNTAPIDTGVVTRLLVNPFGEVDGLVLDSGTLLKVLCPGCVWGKKQLLRSSRQNLSPVKRIDRSLLMRHEHTARALVKLM